MFYYYEVLFKLLSKSLWLAELYYVGWCAAALVCKCVCMRRARLFLKATGKKRSTPPLNQQYIYR